MAFARAHVCLTRTLQLGVVLVALFDTRAAAFSSLRDPIVLAPGHSFREPGAVPSQVRASLAGGRLLGGKSRKRTKQRRSLAPKNASGSEDEEAVDDVAGPERSASGSDRRPLDKAISNVGRDSQNVASKVSKVDEEVPAEVGRDKRQLQRYFLPGFEMSLRTLALMSGAFCFAMLWMVAFFGFIYENDRCEVFGSASQTPKPADKAGAKKEFARALAEWQSTMLFGYLDKMRFARASYPPDIMIAFHHPDVKSADDEELVHRSAMEEMFRSVSDADRGLFPKVQALIDRDVETSERSSQSSYMQGGTNKRELRVALLQDLYSACPKFGMSTDIYRSVHGECLFVCLSMDSDAWIQHYLRHQHLELHVARDVVSHPTLGVGACADADAQSAPFVRFEPWLVARMSERGVIAADDPRLFYKTHHGKNPDGELLNGLDRSRLICQQISRSLNLDAARGSGLITDWFPTHSLLSLQKLGVTWASFSKLADFSFVQPVNFLFNYFGARIAFAFAWQGLMCKAYLVLVPVALVWELSTFAGRTYLGVDQRGFTAFSLIIVTWAKVANNLWDREEEYFTKLWNLKPSGQMIRPEFRGKPSVSDVDSNVSELQVSRFEAMCKGFAAGLVTLGFVLMVAVCIFVWIQIFEGRMNMVASICMAIQIKVFELIFNVLANALNEWQNHKYYEEHYNSLLLKQFCFRFVNSYATFFYLAVKQRHTAAGCPLGGCLVVMQHQLSVTLVLLSVLRVVTVTLTSFQVQLSLWLEDRDFRSKHDGAEAPKRTFMEEQSKYSENRVQEQIEAMLELVISLGYVILFGGVTPIIIPFCFAVFIVQLRAQAFLLVTSTKRTIARQAQGIGYWRSVIAILMFFGVLFNGVLLGIYGDNLQGQHLITKVTMVFIFCLMASVVSRVVDIACPGASSTARLMTERRSVVMNRLLDEAALAADDLESARRRSSSRRGEVLSMEGEGDDDVWVAKGEWDKIQDCHDPGGEF